MLYSYFTTCLFTAAPSIVGEVGRSRDRKECLEGEEEEDEGNSLLDATKSFTPVLFRSLNDQHLISPSPQLVTSFLPCLQPLLTVTFTHKL